MALLVTPQGRAAHTAISAARNAIGESSYQATRSAVTWSASLTSGFLPLNPIIIPMQLAIFAVAILVLIYVADVSPGKAALGAYIIQGVIATFVAHKIADKVLKYGLQL